MARRIIKPARAGLVVKDPDTLIPIPESGIEVEISKVYWQRRLLDGDIVVDEISVTATPKAKAQKGEA